MPKPAGLLQTSAGASARRAAQEVLAAPVAHAQRSREPDGESTTLGSRNASALQAVRHGRTIQLHQDVVGEVAGEVDGTQRSSASRRSVPRAAARRPS